jgi:uncharacterized integral membrane protein
MRRLRPRGRKPRERKEDVSMGIIIIPAVIVALIAIFSIQNSSPVAISFLFWKTQVSLALAILVSALAGIIAGAVIISVAIRKMSRSAKSGR